MIGKMVISDRKNSQIWGEITAETEKAVKIEFCTVPFGSVAKMIIDKAVWVPKVCLIKKEEIIEDVLFTIYDIKKSFLDKMKPYRINPRTN